MGFKNLEQKREYHNNRHKKVMKLIIQHLGGKCVNCGSVENLQIDHIDRTTKLFNVSTGVQNYSMEKVWTEVRKCQLLCKICHRQKGIKVGDIVESKHGSYSMYDRRSHGCRCIICKEANSRRAMKFRKRKLMEG